MHLPVNLPTADQHAIRRDDIAISLSILRRDIKTGGRPDIETACHALRNRVSHWSSIDADDAEEICATVELIERRVQYGMHERLRRLMLPLAAAIERQIEVADEEQL